MKKEIARLEERVREAETRENEANRRRKEMAEQMKRIESRKTTEQYESFLRKIHSLLLWDGWLEAECILLEDDVISFSSFEPEHSPFNYYY